MTELAEDKRRYVAQRCAHFNLKKAVRAVTQRYDEALGKVDLRISQFTLLVSSSLAGPSSIGDLAEQLAMDRTTLSRNVQPLAKRGLLELTRSQADSRARLVEITPAGERLLARAYPLWEEAQKEVTQTFDKDAYEHLLKDMRTLTAAGEALP